MSLRRVDAIDGKYVLKKEMTYDYRYLPTVSSKHWPLLSAIQPSPTSVIASAPPASGKQPVFSTERFGTERFYQYAD